MEIDAQADVSPYSLVRCCAQPYSPGASPLQRAGAGRNVGRTGPTHDHGEACAIDIPQIPIAGRDPPITFEVPAATVASVAQVTERAMLSSPNETCTTFDTSEFVIVLGARLEESAILSSACARSEKSAPRHRVGRRLMPAPRAAVNAGENGIIVRMLSSSPWRSSSFARNGARSRRKVSVMLRRQ